jgi:hypothetical protein
MEEEKEKEKKQKQKEDKIITMGKEGFLGMGPTFLAVQGVIAVRCN